MAFFFFWLRLSACAVTNEPATLPPRIEVVAERNPMASEAPTSPRQNVEPELPAEVTEFIEGDLRNAIVTLVRDRKIGRITVALAQPLVHEIDSEQARSEVVKFELESRRKSRIEALVRAIESKIESAVEGIPGLAKNEVERENGQNCALVVSTRCYALAFSPEGPELKFREHFIIETRLIRSDGAQHVVLHSDVCEFED
ncbi:MAG: hypothetical protein NUW37_15220 [Planctomycetes bacterium]|nr:hypothetical protein [Planctomycetota bacterium]